MVEFNTKKIGCLTAKYIEVLGISMEPSPILIGPTNEQHMISEHPDDYSKYFDKISKILGEPDYIGKHPSNNSLKFIKTYDEHVLVAVRVSGGGNLFARSMYVINTDKLKHYIESGHTFKITDVL